jgi:subtilisin family serine protease
MRGRAVDWEQPVVVAVVDSGIDAGHAWFAGAPLVVRDFTGEGLGDVSGHGTFHAGQVWHLAAGRCRLLVARVVAANDVVRPEAVVEALAWARDEGAEVVSIGLGAEVAPPRLHAAVREVAARAAVVAPVGNVLCYEPGPAALYPARYEEVLGAGTRARDGRPGTAGCAGLDVRAEGEAEGPWTGGSREVRLGTSVAAARVAGRVAGLLSLEPRLREAVRAGRARQVLLARRGSDGGLHHEGGP